MEELESTFDLRSVVTFVVESAPILFNNSIEDTVTAAEEKEDPLAFLTNPDMPQQLLIETLLGYYKIALEYLGHDMTTPIDQHGNTLLHYICFYNCLPLLLKVLENSTPDGLMKHYRTCDKRHAFWFIDLHQVIDSNGNSLLHYLLPYDNLVELIIGFRRKIEYGNENKKGRVLGDVVSRKYKFLFSKQYKYYGSKRYFVYDGFGKVYMKGQLRYFGMWKKGLKQNYGIEFNKNKVVSVSKYDKGMLDGVTISYVYGLRVYKYVKGKKVDYRIGEIKKCNDFDVAGDTPDYAEFGEMMLKRNENVNDESELVKVMEVFRKLHNHPNIISVYSYYTKNNVYGMMVEKFDTIMNKRIKGTKLTNNKLMWTQKMRILIDLASAMLFVHKSNLSHNDLVWENILVNPNVTKGDSTVKIVDLSLAKHEDECVVTLDPNVIKMKRSMKFVYRQKRDIFSYGILMYELLIETFIRDDDFKRNRGFINSVISYTNKTKKIQSNFVRVMGFKEGKDVECEAWYFELMKKCWNQDALQRIEFESILCTLVNSIFLDE